MSKILQPIFNFFKKSLLVIQYILVFIYIIFEDFIWDYLAKPIYDFFESFNLIKQISSSLQNANRYLILVIFVTLFGMVELFGILAGGLIISGKIIMGIGVYLFKVPIAIFTFWMFNITKKQLMSFAWFKKSYEWLVGFMDWVKNREVYKSTMAKIIEVKSFVKALRERFFANKSKFSNRLKRFYNTIKQKDIK